MKDTVLPDALLNQIQISKSYISSAAHYSLAPNLNFLNTTKYWIKFDSNYNFISKDSFSFQTYGSFSNIFISNNSIYGTGTLNASGGLGHTYYSAALKKINIFNYVTSMTITGPYAIYTKDGTLQLNVNILPINANNKKIIWSINDSTIASINQNGLVTAKKDGIATVYANTQDGSNLTAQKTISVNNQNVIVQQISIIGNDSIFIKNGFLQLSTQVLPALATNKNILWSISDTNLGTITQTGLLTAKANGTVIVTATAADGGGAKATRAITITNQTVGINEVNLTNPITVYPNPANNVLGVNQLNANFSYKIINLQGQEILNGELKKPFLSIDISKLEAGSYIIGLTTESGIYWKKFVKN